MNGFLFTMKFYVKMIALNSWVLPHFFQKCNAAYFPHKSETQPCMRTFDVKAGSLNTAALDNCLPEANIAQGIQLKKGV